MRNAPTFIAVTLTLVMAGCALSGKPKTTVPATPAAAKPAPAPVSPPPPPALSSPQTQVDLPRSQPLDPAALAAEATPPVEQVVEAPAPSRPTPARRPPANTAPAPTAASPPPEPAPAPQIQEIVPAAEAKRLQDQAAARRREVQQILDQFKNRNPNPNQRAVITTINSLLTASSDAEKRNDMKLADALSSNAQILARDLINGK